MAELVRAFGEIKRRQSDFVSREVYNLEVKGMRDDVAEIKESQKWAMRLLVGQFVALVVGLLLFFLGNIPA